MIAVAAVLLATLGLVSPPNPGVDVAIDTTQVHTQIGQHVSFTTTVRNQTDQVETGLVAYLSVLSVDPDVYVDPEDWSAHRTMYLAPIPPHGAVTVPWEVQVVNDGQFVLFVGVTTQTGPATVDVSDGLRLTSDAQTSLDSQRALPVVAGVPAVLLLVLLANASRRRRLRER